MMTPQEQLKGAFDVYKSLCSLYTNAKDNDFAHKLHKTIKAAYFMLEEAIREMFGEQIYIEELSEYDFAAELEFEEFLDLIHHS